MKDFFLILIGAVCSALGGCIAIWYQAKKARQIRMEEVRGEQQLETYKKALYLIGQMKSLGGPAHKTEDALDFLKNNREWFSMNQILLPHTFVENWMSIESNLYSAKRKENEQQKTTDGQRSQKIADDLINIDKFVQSLANEAEKVLRKELKKPEVKIKSWKKSDNA
jgi:hypothetical protein